MKAGFLVQLAMAIFFGLVAGLPHYARKVLEPRAYVTTTEVVTVTAPAVIVHIDGGHTWTEINASVPPATVVSSQPIQVSDATTSPTYPIVVSESITYSPGDFAGEIPTALVTPTESTIATFLPDPSALSQSITSSPSELLTLIPISLRTTASLSSRAYSEIPSSIPSSVPGSYHGKGYGISYNPYNDDKTCKEPGAIDHDINSFSEYGAIRLYGTDCNQLNSVMTAVQKFPEMKLMLGIWDADNRGQALNESDWIIDAVNNHFGGDWSRIHSISVGNEVIHRGGDANALLDILKAVKGKLSPFNVPVVTVETPDVFQGIGKDLCQESDFIAINAHPFFDNSGSFKDPTLAGDFVKLMSDEAVKNCGNKRVVITESGWPHGSTFPMGYFLSNNRPVPNPENHLIAIKALEDAYAGQEQNLFVFSAFNDLWKTDNDGTLGVEHYWGIIPQ